MAGKMEPEEAFRLINHRGGVKHRPLSPGLIKEEVDAEDKLDGSPQERPKWLRYTIISIVVIVALSFIAILASGVYLLYDKKEVLPQEVVVEEPLIIFSEAEIEGLITIQLKAFLSSATVEEKLNFVLLPDRERLPMHDFYRKRNNIDTPLWKIKLVKSANLGGNQFWMIAYLDVAKKRHFVRFERQKNEFLLQWSSSYSYGQMSWNTFTRQRPRHPVQMRCFLRPHEGAAPAKYPPETHAYYVVEDKLGHFTSVAVMKRDAEGSHLLKKIQPHSRNPVNLLLAYAHQPDGTSQLTIQSLLHFQWHQPTLSNKGEPVQLKE